MGLLDMFKPVGKPSTKVVEPSVNEDDVFVATSEKQSKDKKPSAQINIKKEKFRAISQDDLCPILYPSEDYDGDVILNKFGDWSVMYEFKFPEVYAIDRQDYEMVVGEMSRAINNFESGYIIHFMYFCTPSDVVTTANSKNLMDKWFSSHLGVRRTVAMSCYVTFTKVHSPERKATDYNGFFSFLSHKPVFEESHYTDKAVQRMEAEVEKFLNTVANSLSDDYKKISFNKLSAYEAFDICSARYLNGSWAKATKEKVDIINKEDYMTLGDKNLFILAMSHNGYPAELRTSVLDDKNSTGGIGEIDVSFSHQLVYALDFPHIVHNIIYTLDPKTVRSEIEARGKQMKSLSAGSTWNQAKSAGIEEHIKMISEHPEFKMVEHFFAVELLTESGNEQERSFRLNRTRNLLSALDIGVTITNHSTTNFFLSLTPGATSAIPRDARAFGFSQYPACMNCYENLERSQINGVPFLERRYNTPVMVDFWNYPGIENRNGLTIGSSGAGKSFLLGNIISYFLYSSPPTDVIIMDIGFSYKKLLLLEEDHELKDKRYNQFQSYIKKNVFLIESTPQKPLMYNPFLVAVKNVKNGDWELPKDDLELDPTNFITTLVFMAWRAGDVVLTAETYAVLTRSVEEYYDYFNAKAREEREITDAKNAEYSYPSFTSYYKFMLAEFKRIFPRVSEKHFDIESFELVLDMYANGRLKNILNPEKNPDVFNASFVIFELEYIKDDKFLFGITSLIIMQVILDKMIYSKTRSENKGKRTYVLMDEVWKVLSSSMKPFIQYMYKTARKHDGAINIATQEVADIINSGIGDAINANSDIKVLTIQKQDKRAMIQNYFSLTDAQTSLLYSCRKRPNGARDVFFKFGSKASAFTFEVSPEQALILSSFPKDKADVYTQYEKTQNMERSVYQVLENRKTKGYVDENFQ